MDYRAVAELVWFSLLGLSILTLVVGFSVRVLLAPVIRETMRQLRSDADRERQLLGVRMDRVEERLSDMEAGIARLAAVEEFNRRLRAPKGSDDEEG